MSKTRGQKARRNRRIALIRKHKNDKHARKGRPTDIKRAERRAKGRTP